MNQESRKVGKGLNLEARKPRGDGINQESRKTGTNLEAMKGIPFPIPGFLASRFSLYLNQ
jgi:hypothetical protein